MADTLHFTLPPERLHPAMGELLSNLNAEHDGYQLRVADALWAERLHVSPDAFLKLTNSDYGAGFNQVDFKGSDRGGAVDDQPVGRAENRVQDQGPYSRRVRLTPTRGWC